jgi:hypothetical protein
VQVFALKQAGLHDFSTIIKKLAFMT